MGKPRPPEPPDPVETSASQTGTNVSTTIANNMMGAMNQTTPYGSISYDQTDSYTWTDPYTNETYEVPIMTATQTYTPEQQAIADQQMAASTSMATTAANQADFLQNYLSEDFNPDIAFADVPDPVQQQQIDLGNAPKPQNLQKNVFGADAKTKIANVGKIDRGNAQGGRVQTDVNGVDLQNKLGNAGNIKTNVNNAGNITTRGADEGPLTKNIYGADYQKKVAGQDAVQGFNTGEGVVDSYGGDFSEDRQRVENAIMERMNPQIERDRENLRAQMANSGISIGSDAYSASNEDFQRGINDARLGAIMAGGQEQSRMVGLEADRAAFTNSARGQEYNQNLGAAAFRNDARAQDFQQNLAQGQFTNQANAQQFGQNMAQGNFANNAQQQAFQQQMANSQFANQAQAQQYNQNLSDTNVRNDAQAQQFGQNLAGGTFANQAANDQFAQQMAQGNFANQAQAQLYGQDAANIDRGNAAQQQAFNQAQIRTDTANAARDQNFQQNLAQAGFSNQALSAQYAQQMAAYDAANQAQMSEAGFNNNAMNQQFGQQMATANMTDAQRQQQLQEMFALRNQPINEISALMSGSQLQGPNFNPTNPQPMPTTDVAGNIWNNYNGQMQNYNIQSQMGGNILGAFGNIVSAWPF